VSDGLRLSTKLNERMELKNEYRNTTIDDQLALRKEILFLRSTGVLWSWFFEVGSLRLELLMGNYT
jgi:hypothetical protein